MDAAAVKFLGELSGIEEHYAPILESLEGEREAITRKIHELTREEAAQVDLITMVWAAQSERPGHIRQAALVASGKLRRNEGMHINLKAARSILNR